MSADSALIEKLERANYLAQQPSANATPGLDLQLRDDVVLMSSQAFPSPDSTHACLLQTTPDNADALLDEILAYYDDLGLPPTLYISPACKPDDYPERLAKRGFQSDERAEDWIVLDDLVAFVYRETGSQVRVCKIDQAEAETFASVMLAAFGMPSDFAPYLAEMLSPSVGLPNTMHYLAYIDDTPVATANLITHDDICIIGGFGILKDYRNAQVSADLFNQIIQEAKLLGMKKMVGQVSAGGRIEKLALDNHFRILFSRQKFVRKTD